MIGVRDDDTNRNTLFACGVREIASGIGILMGDRPVVPVWARVGGDVMDLAFLGRGLRSDRSEKSRVAAATAAVLGVTLLDVMTGRSLGAESTAARGAAQTRVEVREQITIGKPPEELYRFWRDFQNLPAVHGAPRVRARDWTTAGRAGRPGRRPARRSNGTPRSPTTCRTSGSRGARSGRPTCHNSGTVRFLRRPATGAPKSTSSCATTHPAAKLGAVVAKLFGEEPGAGQDDLRRLKQVMETGEVVHSDASIHRGMHPAQPSGASTPNGRTRSMKANCWMGKKRRSRSGRCPTRRF